MGLFTEANLRARAERGVPLNKSTGAILNERVVAKAEIARFDVFLSHSLNDQQLILGIWLSLEDMGYEVYVDWIHDRHLKRESVNKETARVLQRRMRSSKSLFFATTTNSSSSKWMPWELGYQDGHNSRAAILPVSQTEVNRYVGQEYLGIYPYVTKDPMKGQTKTTLWINESQTCYVTFDDWLNGHEPTQR